MENYINILWIYLAAVNIALFVLMRTRVDRLAQLKKMQEDGTFDMLPKKEVMGRISSASGLYIVPPPLADFSVPYSIAYLICFSKKIPPRLNYPAGHGKM